MLLPHKGTVPEERRARGLSPRGKTGDLSPRRFKTDDAPIELEDELE